MDDVDPLDPDLLAGRYRLGELLGRGGMGEVRAARDLTLGRDVAVKLLHPGLAGDEKVKNRFLHEARAAARLAHPNVVRVYDAGEDRGRPYIVMERLDGTTLADEIARGPLAEARVRVVGVQVLEALAAAHRHGVLHRDIKPSNVMLAPDGNVRVADFGIAKSELATDGTTTGTVVGTLGYLPPERLHGEPATTASDTYAVGVVLYEALAGRRPFVGDSAIAVLASVQRGAPAPLDALRPDVDVTLPYAIARAMAVAPQERYASAAEFADALRNPRAVPPPPATAPPTTAMPAAPAPAPNAPPPNTPVAPVAAARRASAGDLVAFFVLLAIAGVALGALGAYLAG